MEKQSAALKSIVTIFGLLASLGLVGIVYLIVFGSLSGNLGFGNDISGLVIINESGAYVNSSGYLLNGYNSSWSAISATSVWANVDRKSTRLNSSHIPLSRMPSSA